MKFQLMVRPDGETLWDPWWLYDTVEAVEREIIRSKYWDGQWGTKAEYGYREIDEQSDELFTRVEVMS